MASTAEVIISQQLNTISFTYKLMTLKKKNLQIMIKYTSLDFI